MNFRRTVLTRLTVLALGLSAATAPVRAAEAGLWERIWGNTDTAQETEKDFIYAHRAGLVIGGGLLCAALVYALWKMPATNKFITGIP